MSQSWTVDSIEEGIAAVHEENGRLLHVPAWLLPNGTREGDVVVIEREPGSGSVTLRLRIDRAATERALAASRDQLARLRQGDSGGDIQM
ncbi:MAG TPA: DUF3006 domain-containing protein [Longimicrobium sp.]|jgi:hypothetical protein